MEYLYQFLVSIYYPCYSFFYILLYIVAIFLLGTGIEDFAVDMYFWILTLFNPKWIKRLSDLPLSKLNGTPEKPIAVFIPAWQESAVIGHMLRKACGSILYETYDIFVGVYPNDPETIAAVKDVAEEYSHVHLVIGSVPGSTTKADNLNQIYQGMRRHENQTGKRYDIIIMHDSEDIIHPMSLKIINYFVPDYDMVQLPVFPLEVPHHEVIEWDVRRRIRREPLERSCRPAAFCGIHSFSGRWDRLQSMANRVHRHIVCEEYVCARLPHGRL